MFTAKQAKRLYREMCTRKVARMTAEGVQVVERKRKEHAPSFRRWVRDRVRTRVELHDYVSPKLHRIVFGGA